MSGNFGIAVCEPNSRGGGVAYFLCLLVACIVRGVSSACIRNTVAVARYPAKLELGVGGKVK